MELEKEITSPIEPKEENSRKNISYSEKCLLGRYMPADTGCYECDSCNSCGSGDCNSCCSSPDGD